MVAMFVILTIITFVTVDHFVHRAQIRHAEAFAPAAASEGAESLIPEGAYLHRGHTWVSPADAGGLLTIGVGPMAIGALGKPDDMCLLPGGTRVKKGQPLFKLGNGARRITLRSPVDGVISKVNNAALDDSSRVSNDPFGNGWLYRIAPDDPEGSLDGLMSGDKAHGWLQEQATRLRDFLAGIPGQPTLAGATMQDGGLPIAGYGSHLRDEEWERLVDSFLGLSEEK